MNVRARVVRGLVLVATVALLAVLASRVDWGESWRLARAANPMLLLLAVSANLLSLVVKGVRWWLFVRMIAPRAFWLALRATVAGAGLNNVLVANGGDAARVLFVARATGTGGAPVLATLALDRILDAVSYVLIVAVAALTLPLPPAIERWRPVILAVAGALLVATAWLLVTGARRSAGAHSPAVAEATVARGLGARIRAFAGETARTGRELSTPGRITGAFALSVVAWALQLATFVAVARAAGATLPVAAHVSALVLVNTGFALRATPGNVGLFQVSYALAVLRFGVDGTAAVAIALLLQAAQFLPVTLAGIVLAPEFLLRRPPATAAS